jgi:hypothetical protein
MSSTANLIATYGSDPELMLFDRQANKIVSAIPVLQHDKHNPIDLGNGYKVYSDNVLLEAQLPPAKDKRGFIGSLQTVLRLIQRQLGDRYLLVAQASHIYDEKELGPKPAVMHGELPVEWEIGCNPSLNVYEKRAFKPEPFSDGLRTGSFHIHLGNADWRLPDPPSKKLLLMSSKEEAIRLLDIFVGCASVLFDRDESAPARRALYGRAGEFRTTDYGIEYRVLGNYVLRSPALVELVVDLVDHVLNTMRNNLEGDIISSVHEDTVRHAIDDYDTKTAECVLRLAALPDKLLARAKKNYGADLYKAWRLA